MILWGGGEGGDWRRSYKIGVIITTTTMTREIKLIISIIVITGVVQITTTPKGERKDGSSSAAKKITLLPILAAKSANHRVHEGIGKRTRDESMLIAIGDGEPEEWKEVVKKAMAVKTVMMPITIDGKKKREEKGGENVGNTMIHHVTAPITLGGEGVMRM
mmetsp:Transcript_14455/g.24273  ORF Transcript_14455/g.24273 Transcript_14455/m.24273 type:complete len:161 (+) Transcript_14455:13-495(+)